MFFSIGLRPFFLMAGVYAALAMAAWVAWLAADFAGLPAAQAGATLAPFMWHAHELLFGYVVAVIAGFLLTAVPNWTATEPLGGRPLMVLAALWLAGRLAVAAAAWLPAAVVALVDLAFLPALIATVAVPLVRARALRNGVLLGLIAILWAANGLFHLEVTGLAEGTAAAGNVLAVDLVVLLIAIIGGRVVPAFTRNALRARGEGAAVVSRAPLDALAILATAAVLVADQTTLDDALTGGLALAAAVLHLARLSGWQTRRVLGAPILWILHLGYGWLVVGFALKAAVLLAGAVPAAAASHAFTVGAFGSMTLGVMSRAALGHTGRALVVAPSIAAAYVMVSLAALLRLGAPALPAALYGPALLAAAGLWIVAFAVFAVVYWPILARPAPTP